VAPMTGEAHRVWGRGTWRNPPVSVVADGRNLRVTAVENSDAWRHTSYGFVHDSAHALLAPLPAEGAVEVSFLLDYAEQFDQAGIYLHVSDSVWIKAGVEVSDGVPQLGAVVTHGLSDWSVAPVPEWMDREITVRLSRAGNAVTIRARAGDESFRLVRVAPLDESASVEVGPFCASPTRAGLTTTFTRWVETDADATLHPEHD
jgi:regulation of enolase protein 1 (concanavalin A-like superfamily)